MTQFETHLSVYLEAPGACAYCCFMNMKEKTLLHSLSHF